MSSYTRLAWRRKAFECCVLYAGGPQTRAHITNAKTKEEIKIEQTHEHAFRNGKLSKHITRVNYHFFMNRIQIL